VERTQDGQILDQYFKEAYGCGCNSRSSKPAGGISDVAGVFDSHTLPPFFTFIPSAAGDEYMKMSLVVVLGADFKTDS
jgi:hypothetical protein